MTRTTGSSESAPGYEGFTNASDNSNLIDLLLAHDQAALVVVDVQNDYCHPDGALGLAGFDLSTIDPMCDVIEDLISTARVVEVPVIFLQNIHSDATDTPAWRRKTKHGMANCREGTWGAEFYRVEQTASDRVVVKHRYSGFVGTNLSQVLGAVGRTTLVMTGTATNVCVESTARHACMLDYDVVIVEDGVAATDAAAHSGTLQNLDRFFGHVVASEKVQMVWKDAA